MSRSPESPRRRHSAGVTLIELAITIALVGILGALIVNFVAPVRSFIDSSRRAGLADTADTALRRIGRDVRLALPNSVRVTTTGSGATTVYYLEFLLVRTGGRYRADPDTSGSPACGGTLAGDVLSFGSADTCFTSIGAIQDIGLVTTSDSLVVYNLQPGTAGADAYDSTVGPTYNRAQIASGTAGTTVKFSSNAFSYQSPGNRFFIIEGPVSYVCDKSAGSLTRYSGYAITRTQPTSFGSGALLASGVSDCSFTYDASVSQGVGLMTMSLQLKMLDSRSSPEFVNLYHAVHVNNVP